MEKGRKDGKMKKRRIKKKMKTAFQKYNAIG